MSTKKEKSFWKTLPGIITAITGLVVAITGLVAALGDYGIIEIFGGKKPTPTTDEAAPTSTSLATPIADTTDPTPTPFPTSTPVDSDVILPTPVPVTAEPEPEPTTPPTCTDFQAFTGKANPNAIILAYTDSEFWVQYGGLDASVKNKAGVTMTLFSKSDSGAICLRDWVKYLTVAHTPHWPSSGDGQGRSYHEVWLNSLTPPLVGELSSWAAVPDNILITVIDEDFNPESITIYICGEDIPEETLGQVYYWHAATSEEALSGYVELYSTNGYAVMDTVSCQN
jgi:hypothetical protein